MDQDAQKLIIEGTSKVASGIILNLLRKYANNPTQHSAFMQLVKTGKLDQSTIFELNHSIQSLQNDIERKVLDIGSGLSSVDADSELSGSFSGRHIAGFDAK